MLRIRYNSFSLQLTPNFSELPHLSSLEPGQKDGPHHNLSEFDLKWFARFGHSLVTKFGFQNFDPHISPTGGRTNLGFKPIDPPPGPTDRLTRDVGVMRGQSLKMSTSISEVGVVVSTSDRYRKASDVDLDVWVKSQVDRTQDVL